MWIKTTHSRYVRGDQLVEMYIFPGKVGGIQIDGSKAGLGTDEDFTIIDNLSSEEEAHELAVRILKECKIADDGYCHEAVVDVRDLLKKLREDKSNEA